MRLSWNLLGIFAWVVVILYLLFIAQNIRKRHLRMIINDRKRFAAKTFVLDLVQILILAAGVGYLLQVAFFDDPNLTDKSVVTSRIEYRPLILTASSGHSYYVTATSKQKTTPVQSYTIYYDSRKITVNSRYATISSDRDPLSIAASVMPYSHKALLKADSHYQRAYTAVFSATYKDTWRNGLGLHAGRMASQYYLIRVPDTTFIRRN